MVLFGMAAIMPFNAVRHLPLFALALLVFVGEHIEDAWSRVYTDRSNQLNRPRSMVILSIIASIVLLILSFINFRQIRNPNEPVSFLPDNAVALLKMSKVTGNLAVDFNWGESVIWHLAPGIKVSMDGRRETVYPDLIYQDYLNFKYGMNDWDALLDTYDTDMALVRVRQPTHNLMKLKSGWELIYEDSTSALFASQEWSQINILRDHAAAFEIPPPKSVFP
jgi:hypothetical protein